MTTPARAVVEALLAHKGCFDHGGVWDSASQLYLCDDLKEALAKFEAWEKWHTHQSSDSNEPCIQCGFRL